MECRQVSPPALGGFFIDMAEAVRDENRVVAIQGVSSIDGATPTRIAVNPVTLALIVEVSP